MSEPVHGVPSLRGSRVLVVGAGGFIGRWVARALTAGGAAPLLVVRDRHAASPVLEQYGAKGEIIEVDLFDLASGASWLSDFRPAVTFNLAGYGVDQSERDDTLFRRLNCELVRILAEAVAGGADPAWRGVQLVHVGSALEYGTVGGRLEEDGPASPTTSYGTSKLAGTRMLNESARRLGIRALTARLFTVYGPGEHASRLLPSIIAAAASDTLLPLTRGEQRRDFTYVEDVAGGLLRLAVSDAGAGEVINLATGTLHTVREFAVTAARVFGLGADRLQFGALPTRAEEMAHEPVSIDRLEQRTGWLPPSDLTRGLELTRRFLEGR